MLEKILDILETENFVFLTGAAGCGKTTLTQKIISHYHDNEKSVAVTASTGLAAKNLFDSGRTIHSSLSLGISNNLNEFLSSKFKFAKSKIQLNTLDLLIIDEISMLSADFFDLIFYKLSNDNFSGKILILGDFLQLPPVDTRLDEHGKQVAVKFAFESELFLQFKIVLLTKVKRVIDGYPNFLVLLNRIRFGEFNIYDEIELKKYQVTTIDAENNTILVATNTEATAYNMEELAKNISPLLSNTGFWTENVNPVPKGYNLDKLKEELLKNIIPPDIFVYKIGAKVLITSNDIEDDNYVNGDRGTILEVIDSVIKIELINKKIVFIKPKNYDIVISTGKPQDYLICSFIQFPLVLAYSITIHKSQGLSLTNLQIDCRRIFSDAQFYVALSRASDPSTLGIANFSKRLITANPKATNFYKNINTKTNLILE